MECMFLVSLLQVHSEVRVQASQGFISAGYFVTWAQAAESGQSWPVGISHWLWFPGYPVTAILRTEYLAFSRQHVCDGEGNSHTHFRFLPSVIIRASNP